jgi:hypothetical protein
MTPKVGRFLGRTVLVSIPALFGDGVCRPYKLLGLDLHGLWLESDDLSQRLLSEETRDLAQPAPAVFVPFAQIAAVLVPTALATEPPTGSGSTGAPTTHAAASAAAKKTRTRQRPTNESGG